MTMKKVTITAASAKYLRDISRDGCLNIPSFPDLDALEGKAFIEAAQQALKANRVPPAYRKSFREDLTVYADAWTALATPAKA